MGGFLDAAGNYIQMEKGGDIASASPTVIDTDGDFFAVTGTTNFSAFTVAADRHFFLEFGGALTMTHGNGTLDLPGGANITTAASDVGEFVSTAANVVTCVNYTKRDGTAVVAAAGGAWNLIGTQEASDDASLTQTGLDATYDTYVIVISNWLPITVGTSYLTLRVGDSSGIDSGASDYAFVYGQHGSASVTVLSMYGDASAAEIRVTGTGGGDTGEGINAMIYLQSPSDGTMLTAVHAQMVMIDANGDTYWGHSAGSRLSVITHDRVSVLQNTGNIESGRFSVYGIAHA